MAGLPDGLIFDVNLQKTLMIQGKKIALLPLLMCGFLFGYCIREEAPNAEADIESCTLPGDVLNREPEIGNDHITLYLKKGAPLTALAPEFTLTPGATIVPESGTVRDFTTPQTYTVTSEDGHWHKEYRITAMSDVFSNTLFSFENTRMNTNQKYYIFYETGADGKTTMEWASGNAGFLMTGKGKTPEDYPTSLSADGYEGSCLLLTTCETGSFGTMMNMPIAAGNLFTGFFNVTEALSSPLKATHFGTTVDKEPVSLSGWYRYESGPTFYTFDKGSKKMQPQPGRQDNFHIYGVFYESTDEMPHLDGTNALDDANPNIISVADFVGDGDTAEWTEFSIDFKPRPGRQADPLKLAAGQYKLAIVFTSSLHGELFEGAPGSRLWVDEVRLTNKDQ